MAVTGDFALALSASFSWTDGSGGSQTISTVGFMDVAWFEMREVFETTPVGYLQKRRTMGILDCRAGLGFMFDKSGATPTSPGMTAAPPTNPGTLVVTFASGKTKTAFGFINSLSHNASGGSSGGAQRYQYGFLGSAEGPTSTITTA